MAFYSIDPWGPERTDLNFGILTSTIVNMKRDPRKGQPLSPKDFMPRYGEPLEESEMPAPKVLKAKMLETFGHMIKRKKSPDGR